MKDALDGLVSREAIQGYTCSRTKEEVEATKCSMLEVLPPVLILHLKCFIHDKNGGCQKLTKEIEYSVDLEISKGKGNSFDFSRSKLKVGRYYLIVKTLINIFLDSCFERGTLSSLVC